MLEQPRKDAPQDHPTPTPSTDVVVDGQASVGAKGVQDDHPPVDTPHAPLVSGSGNATTGEEHAVPLPVKGTEAAAGTSTTAAQPTGGEPVAALTTSNGEGGVGDSNRVEPTTAGDGGDVPPPSDILIVDTDPQEQAKWEKIAYNDDVPLLDLQELRQEILDSPYVADGEPMMERLAKEYKHYFWNQIISEERRKLLKKKYVTDIFGQKADQRVAMTLEEQQAAEDAVSVPKHGRSLFGEALMFKLRAEDKSPKKETVPMTDVEDAAFVEEIHAHFKEVERTKPPEFVARAATAFAFELTSYLIAKMIMSSEVENPHVENLCLDMLLTCAKHGNAKEMDVCIRNTIAKFSKIHFEGQAFHGVTNIMRVWGVVVARIPRRRGGFVLKMLRQHDQMLPAAEGHRTAFYFDEDCPHLEEDIRDVMIDNYARLLIAQEEQWKENEVLQQACTINGNIKGDSDRVICQLQGGYRQRSLENLGDKASKADPPQEKEQAVADDWLAERHYLLVSSLNLLKETIYKVTIPPQAHEQKKETKKDRNTRRRNLERIKKLMAILKQLGFTNTLRGTQLSSLYTYNEPMLPEHETMQKGFGPTVKFTVGTKYTALSHAATSIFFFLSLVRHQPNGNTADLLEFSLDCTGFHYLTKKKQFDTAMPYIMSLLTLSPRICTVAAVRLAKLFIPRTNELWDDEETHLWRFGLPQSGRPVSLFGFTMQMARLVERLDDKALRAEMYATFQKSLRLIKSPHIRFGIVNQLITETRRIEMEAQLVTELKDVIAYADSNVCRPLISDTEREDMRMCFIQNLYPRYFLPRKDSLAVISPMIALTMATLFLAIRDKPVSGNIDGKKAERVKLMKMFMKVANEIFRSVCKCAEHDMKKIPQHTMRKNPDAKLHFNAAKQTLADGMTGINTIERIVGILSGKEDD